MYDEAKTMEQFKTEGKAEGKLEAVVNIIKTLDLSIDKAMDAIGIAANERKKYASLVRSVMQS